LPRFYPPSASIPTAKIFAPVLYISRMLVEAHGGRIWAASTPGSGSTFTAVLPLAD
jgi:hypothetical protein